MKWIRVASQVAQDDKVWAIADAAGCDGFKVIGHLVTLWGVMTEHAKDGDLSDTADTLLERWAQWDGARGVFADAVRAHLCDDRGVVAAWERYQGAALREAEQDAESARARRAAQRAARRGDVPPTSGRRNPDGRGDVGPHSTARDETEIVAAAGLRVRDDGEVDGSPIADLRVTAEQLTSAVNRGIADAHGESTRPLRAPAQLAVVEAWLAVRPTIDMAWARQWLYDRARSSPARNKPGSLAYWRDALPEAWDAHQAQQMALSFEPAPGVVPGVAVVPLSPARRPTGAGRDTAGRDVLVAALKPPTPQTEAVLAAMYGDHLPGAPTLLPRRSA